MTDPDGSPPAGMLGPSFLRPYVSSAAEPGADAVAEPGADAVAEPGADAVAEPASDGPRGAPEDAARLPPYLLTGGRARPIGGLEMEAQVLATHAGHRDIGRLSFESRDIVAACREPLALAEVAARLGLHLGVTRVLVSDLVTTGRLAVRRPESDPRRRAEIIERVIRGLERID